MRITFLLPLLLAAGCSPVPPATRSASSEGLRHAGAKVLFWSQAERDRNFPAMERLFPGRTAPASSHPRPLPDGPELILAGVERYMADNNVAGLIVVQDGRVRLERYARGFAPRRRYTSFSVAKSLTSTLVGAAIADGVIRSIHDPIVQYLPELAGSSYDGVTVRQLLTMTSGVAWNEDYSDAKSDVARMLVVAVPESEDQILAYMRQLPRAAPPGQRWHYSTGETNLVGVLVRRATGRGLADYAAEKIWQPYGMEAPLFWQIGLDGQEIGGCCISVTLRDYARFGQFVLEDGVAAGRHVVPKGWFAQATGSQADIGAPGRGYGYQWWTDGDAFAGYGIFGQALFVDPARRLVIVQAAAWPKASDPALGANRRAFIERVRLAADEALEPR